MFLGRVCIFWEVPPQFGCIPWAGANALQPFGGLDSAVSNMLCWPETGLHEAVVLRFPSAQGSTGCSITSSTLEYYLSTARSKGYMRASNCLIDQDLLIKSMQSFLYWLFHAVCIKELFVLFLFCTCTAPCTMVSGPCGRPFGAARL